MQGRIAVIAALVMTRNKTEGDKLKSLVEFSEDMEDDIEESSWGFELINQAPFLQLLSKYVNVKDAGFYKIVTNMLQHAR